MFTYIKEKSKVLVVNFNHRLAVISKFELALIQLLEQQFSGIAIQGGFFHFHSAKCNHWVTQIGIRMTQIREASFKKIKVSIAVIRSSVVCIICLLSSTHNLFSC